MHPPRQPVIDRIFSGIALASGIACAVIFWMRRTSLWEDEIIAITHGLQPLPEFFFQMFRNDMHPFLYFLGLKFWASLNIGSDKWVLASSLAGATASAVALGIIAARTFGRGSGLWATAMFVVVPTFAWSAANLRMYALLPGMIAICWFVNGQYFKNRRRWLAIAIVVIELMTCYMHAIEFYFVAFVAAANLFEHWRTATRKQLVEWSIAQGLVLASIVPLVLVALVRGTEPLAAPNLASLVMYPAEILTAWPLANNPVALALGGFTFVFYLSLGLRSDNSRTMVLFIPCGALAACILLSSLGKPMFKPPVFMANLLPFLALGAAAGIHRLDSGALKYLVLFLTAGLAICVWPATRNATIEENYKPAGLHILASVQPGDVVVVPNLSVFWGIVRYAVGPNWGLPLEVMPLKSSESWENLKKRLGDSWSSRLHLIPKVDNVVANGVTYVVGKEALHHLHDSPRVWIVHRMNYRETVNLDHPVRIDHTNWFGKELSVTLVVPDSNGVTSVSNPPVPASPIN